MEEKKYSPYNPNETEPEIYALWEKNNAFTPKVDKTKKPFSILLPLPNANDSIHMGHVMFTVQDIMARHHRMLGEETLWLPGADHAGIETQFVFEKKLSKEGKSRFDFDRETLYKMIAEFVEQNREKNLFQLKRLGFSLDWSRFHYSLEPEILKTVFATFRKLHADGLIYRGERMVNYCTKCGTAFSDLEVDHIEKDDFLYYLDYGPISIATTRPETIFADVAVAVNPKDKRHTGKIGQVAHIPLTNNPIPIITDEEIQIDFGTGALKVTPAHDITDYEIGQKHNLPIIRSIDTSGRMINVPEKYIGLKVTAAREAVVADLTAAGKIIKTEPLKHTVSVCYRCKTTIEPMLNPQWYIKIAPLAKPALEAVKKGRTKIVPKKRFEKLYTDWLTDIHDWNISRQIVWGPRLPIYYCLDCNPEIKLLFLDKTGVKVTGTYGELSATHSFDEIQSGLQSLTAPLNATYSLKDGVCAKCGGNHILQETDTFDTWFLSGQWPLTTLGYPDGEDFKYFYPTSVMDTMWDILFFWVARMMMFGLYLAGEVPFKVVHLHARVVDKNGQKMSKSKGNVIDPLEIVEKYGADALRMTLTMGVAPGSDILLSEEKVRGMRNFINKIWNAARFIITNSENIALNESNPATLTEEDRKMRQELETLITATTKDMDNFRFGAAAERLYESFWHSFCDRYIESTKTRLYSGTAEEKKAALLILRESMVIYLKLMHPFIPFITEKIWQQLEPDSLIMRSRWPGSEVATRT